MEMPDIKFVTSEDAKFSQINQAIGTLIKNMKTYVVERTSINQWNDILLNQIVTSNTKVQAALREKISKEVKLRNQKN